MSVVEEGGGSCVCDDGYHRSEPDGKAVAFGGLRDSLDLALGKDSEAGDILELTGDIPQSVIDLIARVVGGLLVGKATHRVHEVTAILLEAWAVREVVIELLEFVDLRQSLVPDADGIEQLEDGEVVDGQHGCGGLGGGLG